MADKITVSERVVARNIIQKRGGLTRSQATIVAGRLTDAELGELLAAKSLAKQQTLAKKVVETFFPQADANRNILAEQEEPAAETPPADPAPEETVTEEPTKNLAEGKTEKRETPSE